MWAGMATTEYEVGAFGARYRPTGVTLDSPGPTPHGTPPDPWIFTSGPLSNRSAELNKSMDSPMVRALDLDEPFGAPGDLESFRREAGFNSKLERVSPIGTSGSIPWSGELVDVLTTLFFILKDFIGFTRGGDAYPDTIELKAPELPAGLRGTVVANKYGQARP